MGAISFAEVSWTLVSWGRHRAVALLRCDFSDNGHSPHPAGPARGDGLCVAEGMLSGVCGTAPGLKGYSNFAGIHVCNGSLFSIIPSRRIIMDGKRMLTWILSVPMSTTAGQWTHLVDDAGVFQPDLIGDEFEPTPCPRPLFISGNVKVLDASKRPN